MRILVDIAIKALSPAINDPTTAVQALDQIEDILLMLAGRRLPDGVYQDELQFVNLTDHDGDTARAVSLQVGLPSLAYSFPMDTDPGWDTEGQWAFGQPTGSGSYAGDSVRVGVAVAVMMRPPGRHRRCRRSPR